MRRIDWAIPGALLLGAVLVGCGKTTTTATQAAPVGCSAQGATAEATTARYHIVLDVRPAAEMYAPGQVPAGSRTGVVMYAGSMTSASGTDARDVDVHICTASGDRVLSNLKPAIRLKDTTTGITQAVPYATMQDVGKGRADFHYGNTLILQPGHSFALTVDVGGQSARLTFTGPSSAPASKAPSTTMGNMKMTTTTLHGSTSTLRSTTTTARKITSTTMGSTATTVHGRTATTMGGMGTTSTTMGSSASYSPGPRS